MQNNSSPDAKQQQPFCNSAAVVSCVLVVGRVGGGHFAVPVIRKAQRLELLAEAVDVALSGLTRVGARLCGGTRVGSAEN